MTSSLKNLIDLNPRRQKKDMTERKRESRDRIIQVSAELFRENGYAKTTTRQIIQKAGILNGSLYNTFESKEEIFETMILQAYDDTMEQSRKLLENNDDLVVILALPLAIELYVANRSERSAELLYTAHSSWKITSDLVDRTVAWTSVYFEKYGIRTDPATARTNFLALLGCIGNFISRYHNGEHDGYREELKVELEIFCTLFRIPAYDLDAIVEQMTDLIENSELTIGGFKL